MAKAKKKVAKKAVSKSAAVAMDMGKSSKKPKMTSKYKNC